MPNPEGQIGDTGMLGRRGHSVLLSATPANWRRAYFMAMSRKLEPASVKVGPFDFGTVSTPPATRCMFVAVKQFGHASDALQRHSKCSGRSMFQQKKGSLVAT